MLGGAQGVQRGAAAESGGGDSRCLSREREALVKERTRHINTVKALLVVQGVADIGVGRRGWLDRLAEARTGDGRAPGEHLRRRIARLARRLEEVAHQIAEVEAELAELDRQRAVRLPAGATTVAVRLRRLAGIGPISAIVLEEEAFTCLKNVRFRENHLRRGIGRYYGRC